MKQSWLQQIKTPLWLREFFQGLELEVQNLDVFHRTFSSPPLKTETMRKKVSGRNRHWAKGTWGMREEQNETVSHTGEYFMSSFISLTQQKNYLNTTNNTHEFKSKKRG